MDLAIRESGSFQFSSLREIFSSSSTQSADGRVIGEEQIFERESVNFEISHEAQLLARINPEESILRFDFTLNARFEESSFDLFGDISDDPEMKELRPLLDFISEITGRDLGKEIEKATRKLSKALSGEDSSENLEQLARDIARSRERKEEINISLSVEMRTGRTSVEVQGASSDPLVLDLDGDGIETTGVEDGIDFDINADGMIDRTAFATGGDGVLALDRDGDGKITSGKELFGDQNGAKDGFMELGKFDENRDGVINEKDSVFKNLKVAIVNNKGEMTLNSLKDLGIDEIYLNRKEASDTYSNGNYIKEISSFRRTDGSLGNIGELFFRYNTIIDK